MSTHLKQLRGQIDPVLTNLALGYKQAEFIGERIMPVVFTDKEGLRVPVFGKGSFVEYTTERAVGAASNIITLDSPNYMPVVLEEHDLAAGVDYRERAESLYDERAKATRRVTRGMEGGRAGRDEGSQALDVRRLHRFRLVRIHLDGFLTECGLGLPAA